MSYTKTTITMSTTNEMLVARIEAIEKQLTMRVDTLEKQLATLLKDPVVEVKKSKKAAKSDSKTDVVSSDDEVVKVKEPKKSKKSKTESKNESSDDEVEVKKKRGPSGYILFSNENRNDVKEKLHVGEEKPKNTEVMKELALMWQGLDATEKAEWNAKAAKAKAASDDA